METRAKRCRTCAGLKSISVFICFPCSKRKEAMPKNRKHANQRSACSAQAGGHTWGLLVNGKTLKCIDFHRFSIRIFKQQNKTKHGNQSSAGSAQAVPHTWGLWPPDRPSRPAARRRIVAGLPAQEMLVKLKTLQNSLFYK